MLNTEIMILKAIIFFFQFRLFNPLTEYQTMHTTERTSHTVLGILNLQLNWSTSITQIKSFWLKT